MEPQCLHLTEGSIHAFLLEAFGFGTYFSVTKMRQTPLHSLIHNIQIQKAICRFLDLGHPYRHLSDSYSL